MASAFLRLIVLPECAEYLQTPPVDHFREWSKITRHTDAQLRVHENIFRRVMRKLGITRLNIPNADALIALSYIVYGRGAVVHPARRS